MPKGRKGKGRKPYRRPDYGQEYRDNVWATYANNIQPDDVRVDKDPPAPAHPQVTRPTRPPRKRPAAAAPRAPRGRGRYLVPIAAGSAAVGGAAYLLHRRRRQNVGKGLVDPLTGESVFVEKRYIEDDIDEAPRGALVAKRDDETALLHIGGRRGGRTPVSSTRTKGLPVQSASFSQGHPWERGGTSHANKLTHVHTKVKHHPRGTLVHIRHGSRSVSGSSVGKSAAFSQSGGSGRRIVSSF